MRIFLCGDSFTENLYKTEIDSIEFLNNRTSEMNKYVKYYKEKYKVYPLYFDDYLRLWGHEVINFGKGGCCLYDIFNQLANINKYQFNEDDRLIINWTNPGRYEWFTDNRISYPRIFTGGIPKDATENDIIFHLQTHTRCESFLRHGGKFEQELLPFMNYLVELHSKYKPIVWCPFGEVSNKIKNVKYYFYEPTNLIFQNIIPEFEKLLIYKETGEQINDNHYGKYGNYYLAKIFNTILDYTKNLNDNKSNYIDDKDLLDKVIEKIKHNKFNLNNKFI